MNKTFGSILSEYRGLGPGFDFLRIALSFTIVLCHAFLLTGNDEFFRKSYLWFGEYALVPMFFALSGFLIAGSAQRLTLKNFLLNRSLRIVPALAVDIVVCAFIIGPVVTTVALGYYFSSGDFYRYFLNIVGWIHYDLPGVFKDNPTTRVNGALWTVPWEILCYIIMSVLMVTSVINSWPRLAAITFVFFISGLVVQRYAGHLPAGLASILISSFVGRGAQLVLAFLLGILAFQLKDKIPYSRVLFFLCVAICGAAIVLLDDSATFAVENRIVLIPTLVYITMFIGLTKISLPSAFHKGDYSYGVYLYHDPFLQILIGLSPALFLIPKIGALALYCVGIFAAMAVAVVSWHFIEKPILGMRKKFSFVATARGIEGTEELVKKPDGAPLTIPT